MKSSTEVTTTGSDVGTWELRVRVPDLGAGERKLRVRGDLSVGGVMVRLAEDVKMAADWSDHSLWWPDRNRWLEGTRVTLDQLGIMADSVLEFISRHKNLRLQLPDLQYIRLKIDFSAKVFAVVADICGCLKIRHSEEMSLCRPMMAKDLKRNVNTIGCTQRQRDGLNFDGVRKDSTTSSDFDSLSSGSSSFTFNDEDPLKNGGSFTDDVDLIQSPRFLNREGKKSSSLRPKSLAEKARLNSTWLDSSLSLREQDVQEDDTLQLKFKFYSFKDLDPQLDSVRINQIYQQATDAVLREEIQCTEEEMTGLSALILQINLQNGAPQMQDSNRAVEEEDLDLDTALSNLEATLECGDTNKLSKDPSTELSDHLLIMKAKKFTLKGFKKRYAILKDFHLHLYAETDAAKISPVLSLSLRGCSVIESNSNRVGFRTRSTGPGQEETEYWIRTDSEDKLKRWIAALESASKENQISPASNQQNPACELSNSVEIKDINTNEIVAKRFLKKSKGIVGKILESHSTVKHLNILQAKMEFIKRMKRLPEFGRHLFLVQFHPEDKQELLAVFFDRMERMDLSGRTIHIWRFSTLESWEINWELRQLKIRSDQDVIIRSLSADCKIIHEFIGGYIFLSMRPKNPYDSLDHELFHKLTAGWT